MFLGLLRQCSTAVTESTGLSSQNHDDLLIIFIVDQTRNDMPRRKWRIEYTVIYRQYSGEKSVRNTDGVKLVTNTQFSDLHSPSLSDQQEIQLCCINNSKSMLLCYHRAPSLHDSMLMLDSQCIRCHLILQIQSCSTIHDCVMTQSKS